MKKLFIKVCGLTREKDIEALLNYDIQALGFVAYQKSPRYINWQDFKKITKIIPNHIAKVGVFVNSSYDDIQKYIDVGLDIIQLHGNESIDYITKIPFYNIWQAIRLKDQETVNNYLDYPINTFVLDSYSNHQWGGTGIKANWQLVENFALLKPDVNVLLAGGINQENISQALNLNISGIDISSGLESKPGIKDLKKIKDFFTKLKQSMN